MRKSIKAAIGAILICAFAFSMLSRSIPLVKADYDDYYLPSANFYTTNWCMSSDTATATSNAFSYIESLFEQQQSLYYPTMTMYPTYGRVQNWGTSTTPSLVEANIQEDQSDTANGWYLEPFATTLYVGHGGTESLNGYEYGAFYGYDDLDPSVWNNPNYIPTDNAVWSYQISSPSDVNFVFLWVCMNGASCSFDNMAWAWSGGAIQNSDIDSSNNGWTPDSSSSCFISFNKSSPWLDEYIGNGYDGQTWLQEFYYIALQQSTTINEALDMVSWLANGNSGNFASSSFRAQANPNNPYGYGVMVTSYPYGDVTIDTTYWVDGVEYLAGNTYYDPPFPCLMVPWGNGNLELPTYFVIG